jgi:hypothetical protein
MWEKNKMESVKLKTETKNLEWYKELENGSYEVNTKDGVFVLNDVEYDRIQKARKRGESTDNIEVCVLSEMIISKDGEKGKIGEMEIKKYKSSSVMRLLFIMNEVMGVQDFLK